MMQNKKLDSRKLWVVRFIFKLIPDSQGHTVKCCLLRWCGASIGNNVEIMSSAKIMGNFTLIVGNNCFIGHEALIIGPAGSIIQMEDFSKIGSRTTIVTGSHRFSTDGNCIEKEGTFANIKICRGAVVSTGSIIVPGKTIGPMSHVAAGSVVTKNVEMFTRVGGIPAKVIKNFNIQ